MRSRLAPSPTGALHVGNVRTFLLTWLHVRAAGGSLVLRVDDLDGPRVKKGAGQEALFDLTWLGLDWDAGDGVLVQSERAAVYDAAAKDLLDRGLAFPCVCTRSEVESAASAPHGPDGPRYPGTCRGRFETLADAERATGRPVALRFVAPPGPVAFDDLLYGPQAHDVSLDTGDFVIRKSNGTAAYQLATVIDDAATGIDLVLRGSDLLPSTSRQLLLHRALGLTPPRYLHLPLVVGPDGRRLAKRHGDTSVRTLREAGWSAPALIGRIGATADLCDPGEALTPRDLLARYDPKRLSSAPVVLDGSAFASPPLPPTTPPRPPATQ